MQERAKPGATLQPTAIVHEAFLRMSRDEGPEIRNTAHFVAAAAQTMRWILVDAARRRNALRRGGDRGREPLHHAPPAPDPSSVDLESLDQALRALRDVNERHAQVVLLRYFGGLSIDETAQVLQVSRGTVKRDWLFARAWLLCELGDSPSDTPE